MKPFRHKRLDGYFVRSNSITPQSMPAGSTWWRLKLAFWETSALTDASQTSRHSLPNLLHGRKVAMKYALQSNGYLPLRRLGKKWALPTHQIHCDEVLVGKVDLKARIGPFPGPLAGHGVVGIESVVDRTRLECLVYQVEYLADLFGRE